LLNSGNSTKVNPAWKFSWYQKSAHKNRTKRHK